MTLKEFIHTMVQRKMAHLNETGMIQCTMSKQVGEKKSTVGAINIYIYIYRRYHLVGYQ